MVGVNLVLIGTDDEVEVEVPRSSAAEGSLIDFLGTGESEWEMCVEEDAETTEAVVAVVVAEGVSSSSEDEP